MVEYECKDQSTVREWFSHRDLLLVPLHISIVLEQKLNKGTTHAVDNCEWSNVINVSSIIKSYSIYTMREDTTRSPKGYLIWKLVHKWVSCSASIDCESHIELLWGGMYLAIFEIGLRPSFFPINRNGTYRLHQTRYFTELLKSELQWHKYVDE